ncbi:MAG: hypothetical protein AAB389_03515 [Patescibacteria group bacterium]
MDGDSTAKKPTLITAIIILAVVIAVIVGYFVWNNFSKTSGEKANEALDKVSQTGTLPTITSSGNPADQLPIVNPAEQTNPFSKTYKNPF